MRSPDKLIVSLRNVLREGKSARLMESPDSINQDENGDYLNLYYLYGETITFGYYLDGSQQGVSEKPKVAFHRSDPGIGHYTLSSDIFAKAAEEGRRDMVDRYGYPSSSMFSPRGRIWVKEKIITFWSFSSAVDIELIRALADAIEIPLAELLEYRAWFGEDLAGRLTGKKLREYIHGASDLDVSYDKQKELEMMMAQHLDPQVKKAFLPKKPNRRQIKADTMGITSAELDNRSRTSENTKSFVGNLLESNDRTNGGAAVDLPLGWKARGSKMFQPSGKEYKQGDKVEQNIVRKAEKPNEPYGESYPMQSTSGRSIKQMRRNRERIERKRGEEDYAPVDSENKALCLDTQESFPKSIHFVALLTEEIGGDDYYEGVKELARQDVSVLKNLINAQRLYRGDDPQLSGKESQLAINAVLAKLYLRDPKAAYYLGRAEWKPELVNWMGFFDQVGEKPLGQYLGMGSVDDIPLGQSGGVGDNMDEPEVAPEGLGDAPEGDVAGEGLEEPVDSPEGPESDLATDIEQAL